MTFEDLLDRLLMDFPEADLGRVVTWLRIAYEAGYDAAMDECAQQEAGESL